MSDSNQYKFQTSFLFKLAIFQMYVKIIVFMNTKTKKQKLKKTDYHGNIETKSAQTKT